MAQLQPETARRLVACCGRWYYCCSRSRPISSVAPPHHFRHRFFLGFLLRPVLFECSYTVSFEKRKQVQSVTRCGLLQNGSCGNSSFSDSSRYSNSRKIMSSHSTYIMINSHCSIPNCMRCRNITNNSIFGGSNSSSGFSLDDDGSSFHRDSTNLEEQCMPRVSREIGACKWIRGDIQWQQTVRIISAAQTFSVSKKSGKKAYFDLYGEGGKSSLPCPSKERSGITGFVPPDVLSGPPTAAKHFEQETHDEKDSAGMSQKKALLDGMKKKKEKCRTEAIITTKAASGPNVCSEERSAPVALSSAATGGGISFMGNSENASHHRKSTASDGSADINAKDEKSFCFMGRRSRTVKDNERKTGHCNAESCETTAWVSGSEHSCTIISAGRRLPNGTSYAKRIENIRGNCKSSATKDQSSLGAEGKGRNTTSCDILSKRSRVIRLPCAVTARPAAALAALGDSGLSPSTRYVEASLAAATVPIATAVSTIRQERAGKTLSSDSVLKRGTDSPDSLLSSDVSAGVTYVRDSEKLDTSTAVAHQQQQRAFEVFAWFGSSIAAEEKKDKTFSPISPMKNLDGHEAEAAQGLHARTRWRKALACKAVCERQHPGPSLSAAFRETAEQGQQTRRTGYNNDVAFAEAQDAAGILKKQHGYAAMDAGDSSLCSHFFDTQKEMRRRQESEGELREGEEGAEVLEDEELEREDDIIEEEEDEVASSWREEERTATTPGPEQTYATAYLRYMASLPLTVQEEEKVQRMWQRLVHDDCLCRHLQQNWGFPFVLFRHSQLQRHCLRYLKQQIMQQQLPCSSHSGKDARNKHKVCRRAGSTTLRSLSAGMYSFSSADLHFPGDASSTFPEAAGLIRRADVLTEGTTEDPALGAAVLRTTAPADTAAGGDEGALLEPAKKLKAVGCTLVQKHVAGDAATDITAIREAPADPATAVHDAGGPRAERTPRRLATGRNSFGGGAAAAAVFARQKQCSTIQDRPADERRKRMLLFILKHLRAAAGDRATALTEAFAEAVRLHNCSGDSSSCASRNTRTHTHGGYADRELNNSSAICNSTTAAEWNCVGDGFSPCERSLRNATAANETAQTPFLQTRTVAPPTAAAASAAPILEGVCAMWASPERLSSAAWAGFQRSAGDNISNENPPFIEGEAGPTETLASAASGGVCSDTYYTLLQVERRGMAVEEFVGYDRSSTDVDAASPSVPSPLSFSVSSFLPPAANVQTSTEAAGLRPSSHTRLRLAEAAPLLCLMRWYLAEQHADHLLQYRNLTRLADLRSPAAWYPRARALNREIILYAGPPNSGKTAAAVQHLLQAATGCYLAPLRLLAWEIYVQLKQRGSKVSLITGQERRIQEGATHLCCTVEAAPLNKSFACGVIDEAQLISSHQRGDAWTRALLGLPVQQLHVCCEERAVPLLQKLFVQCKETCCVRHYQRLAPLFVDQQPVGDLEALRTGDCLVCFTRVDVLKLRRRLLALGFDVYAIYGQLPPAVKQRQANMFNAAVQQAYEEKFSAPSSTAGTSQTDFTLADRPTVATSAVRPAAPATFATPVTESTAATATAFSSPTTETSTSAAARGRHLLAHRPAVLVATDAIGLGLNLHIRRIVFYRLQKYAGNGDGAARLLTAAEIRQLAGRAGRRSGVWGETGGFVSCMKGEDFERVKEAIQGNVQAEHLGRAALLPSLRQLIAFCEELERQESPGNITAAGESNDLQSVLSSLAATEGIQAKQQGVSGNVHTSNACRNSNAMSGRRTTAVARVGMHVCNEATGTGGSAAAATAFRHWDAAACADAGNDSATSDAGQRNNNSTAAASEREECNSSSWSWRGVSCSYAEAVRRFIDLLQVDPLYFVPPHKLNLMLTVVHALADVPLPRHQLFTFCLAPLPFSSPFPFLKFTHKRNEQEQEQQQQRSGRRQGQEPMHGQLHVATAREGTCEAHQTAKEIVQASRPQPTKATEHAAPAEFELITDRSVLMALHAENDMEEYRRTVEADEAARKRDAIGEPQVAAFHVEEACSLPAAALAAAGLSMLLLNALRTFAVLLATCGHVPLPPHVFAPASEAVLHPAANLLQQPDQPIAVEQSSPAGEQRLAGHLSQQQGWQWALNEQRHPAAAADRIRWCSANPGAAPAAEHTTHVRLEPAKLPRTAEEMTVCCRTSSRRGVADARIIACFTEGRAERWPAAEAQNNYFSAQHTALELQQKICCQSHAAADADKVFTTEEAQEEKRYSERLLLLEEYYQIVDLYVWLARKFPAAFVDLPLALQVQQKLVEAIDAHLNGSQQQ